MTGESTSARLRQVEQDRDELQRALAASQQDLSHVEGQLRDAERDRMRAEAERDEARTEMAAWQGILDRVTAERDWARQVVGMLRRNEEIRAQVIQERNAERDRLTRERDEAQEDAASLRRSLAAANSDRAAAGTELAQLRTAVAGVLAELRELAAGNRADANRFRGTSSPNGFGPHRAAEAYEKAVALVEHIHPDREEPTT